MKKIILTCLGISISLLSLSQWTTKADMLGDGKNHIVAFSIDSFGYAISGLSGNTVYSSAVRYDPSNDSWSSLTNFPGGPRGFAVGGSYDGKGYVGFGLGFPPIQNAPLTYFNDLWEYNPDTDTWTELTPCPCLGRRHPAFVTTTNGKIFVGLGDGLDSAGLGDSGFKDWWEYDISTDTWTRKADLPGDGRHHPYYFGIGTDAYAGFGDNAGLIYDDFYKYDAVAETWTTLNDFPGEARVAGGQFSYNGHGYIVDGEGSDHFNLDEAEYYKYYPATDSWEQLASHSGIGLWAVGSFTIGNLVYVVGGDDFGPGGDFSIRTLWAYSLEVKPVDSALTASSTGLSLDADFFDERASFQWVDCNNNFSPLPGETNRSIVIPQDGTYALIVTYSEGGKDTSDCYTGPVSVQENNLDLDNYISVYPNPVKNVLKIEQKQELNETIEYTIVNLLGMEVMKGVINNNVSNTLDLSGFENGVYFLILRSNETEQKVIKIKKID
ncbi:MAG: T9SS type A sorting domain-containing protein [Vicingaceae bacterium]